MKVMIIHLGDPPPIEELDPAFVERMHRYFREEVPGRVTILGGHELHGTSRGKRVRFLRGRQVVVDGPFSEAKEVIAGYSVWEVDSMETAVEVVKGIPQADGIEGGEIEIREIHTWDED